MAKISTMVFTKRFGSLLLRDNIPDKQKEIEEQKRVASPNFTENARD